MTFTCTHSGNATMERPVCVVRPIVVASEPRVPDADIDPDTISMDSSVREAETLSAVGSKPCVMKAVPRDRVPAAQDGKKANRKETRDRRRIVLKRGKYNQSTITFFS